MGPLTPTARSVVDSARPSRLSSAARKPLSVDGFVMNESNKRGSRAERGSGPRDEDRRLAGSRCRPRCARSELRDGLGAQRPVRGGTRRVPPTVSELADRREAATAPSERCFRSAASARYTTCLVSFHPKGRSARRVSLGHLRMQETGDDAADSRSARQAAASRLTAASPGACNSAGPVGSAVPPRPHRAPGGRRGRGRDSCCHFSERGESRGVLERELLAAEGSSSWHPVVEV